MESGRAAPRLPPRAPPLLPAPQSSPAGRAPAPSSPPPAPRPRGPRPSPTSPRPRSGRGSAGAALGAGGGAAGAALGAGGAAGAALGAGGRGGRARGWSALGAALGGGGGRRGSAWPPGWGRGGAGAVRGRRGAAAAAISAAASHCPFMEMKDPAQGWNPTSGLSAAGPEEGSEGGSGGRRWAAGHSLRRSRLRLCKAPRRWASALPGGGGGSSVRNGRRKFPGQGRFGGRKSPRLLPTPGASPEVSGR